VPLTVKVNDPLPSGSVDGEMLVIAGSGFVAVTVKFTAELVPPPGVGLVTVTGRGPATPGSD